MEKKIILDLLSVLYFFSSTYTIFPFKNMNIFLLSILTAKIQVVLQTQILIKAEKLVMTQKSK